jgi:hypothetical protein
VRTLFPPYARPPAGAAPDGDTWVVLETPADRPGAHPVLGRIDLDWGGRPLADVLAEVDEWRVAGVPGLFLDRAPAGASGVGPVALTVRQAARRGLHRVVLNPGVPAHPLYRELGVGICTFDGPWAVYRSWDGAGGQPGDGHLVHDVPVGLLAEARALMGRRGAGFGLATDAGPWVSAPVSGASADSAGS